MNKDRRKAIQELASRLEDIQAELEAIKEEEQESLDALPENLRYSERASTMEEALEQLDAACDGLTEATNALNEF